MSRAWVGRPLYGWRSTPSLKRGSSYSVTTLSEPTERPQSRPIGFRVSQSRQNQAANSARSVRDLIQTVYE